MIIDLLSLFGEIDGRKGQTFNVLLNFFCGTTTWEEINSIARMRSVRVTQDTLGFPKYDQLYRDTNTMANASKATILG